VTASSHEEFYAQPDGRNVQSPQRSEVVTSEVVTSEVVTSEVVTSEVVTSEVVTLAPPRR